MQSLRSAASCAYLAIALDVVRHEGLHLRQNLRAFSGLAAQDHGYRRGECFDLSFGAALRPAVVHLVPQPARGLGEKRPHVDGVRSCTVCLSHTARRHLMLPELLESGGLAWGQARRERPRPIVPRPIPLKGLVRWDGEAYPLFAAFFLPGGLDRPLLLETGQGVLDRLQRHARRLRDLGGVQRAVSETLSYAFGSRERGLLRHLGGVELDRLQVHRLFRERQLHPERLGKRAEVVLLLADA